MRRMEPHTLVIGEGLSLDALARRGVQQVLELGEAFGVVV